MHKFIFVAYSHTVQYYRCILSN